MQVDVSEGKLAYSDRNFVAELYEIPVVERPRWGRAFAAETLETGQPAVPACGRKKHPVYENNFPLHIPEAIC